MKYKKRSSVLVDDCGADKGNEVGVNDSLSDSLSFR